MKNNNQLQLDNRVLELAWNSSTDAIFTIGYDGRLQSLNPTYTTMLGWEIDDFLEENPVPFVVDCSLDRWNEDLSLLKEGHDIACKVKKRRRKDGSIIEVLASYRAINDGEIVAVGMYKEFTEQTQIQRQLQMSEDRYRNLIEYLPDAIFVEKNEGIIFVNSAAVKLVKAISAQELLNKSVFNFFQTNTIEKIKKRILSNASNKDPVIEKLVRLDGKVIWVEIILMSIQEEEEQVLQLLLRDVTDKKNYEEKLEFLAFHDPLTGLTNRRHFTDKINEAIKNAVCRQMQLAVLYLDIDKFKDINDSLGHDVGDILLKQFSNRLRETVRKNDILCRVGGDEFLVLIDDIVNAEEIKGLVKRMHNAFQAPYKISNRTIQITTSIGIALFPKDGNNSKKLILHADEALYKAKLERNQFRFYSE